MPKKSLITISLSISFLFLNGCSYESNAISLPLNLEIKENNICIYTNNKSSFIDENSEFNWYLVMIKPSSVKIDENVNIVNKKIYLEQQTFPSKQENCILVSLNMLELNKPYEFIIDAGRSFATRACIFREQGNYTIKTVTSTENCDT